MSGSDENSHDDGDGPDPNMTIIRPVKRNPVPRPGDRPGHSLTGKTIDRNRLSETSPRNNSDTPDRIKHERDVRPLSRHESVHEPKDGRTKDERTHKAVRPDKLTEKPLFTSNRLLSEASSLLSLGGFLLGSDKPNDLELLRAEILDAVSRYRQNIKDHYDSNTVDSAGFCICAFIDDCVLRTRWGKDSPWSESSILAKEHNTAQRHNLITNIQESIRLGAEPDLFALYHTVLSLGYVGMCDEHELVRLKDDVYREIKSNGHKENLALVSDSIIRAQEGKASSRRLPWWPVLAGAMALSLLVYWIFWSLLQPSVDKFQEALANENAFKHEQLGPQNFFPETPPVPVIREQVVLRQLLLDQGVNEDAFTLVDADPGTRIVLLADEMFASGSTNLNARYLPVLQSIGKALSTTTGPIIVEGHTDNVPFKGGLRTNRSLSTDRSNLVATVLAKQLGASDRLTAKGHAALFPIVCNTNSENRKRNRRVELVLPEIETLGAETRTLPVCDETS